MKKTPLFWWLSAILASATNASMRIYTEDLQTEHVLKGMADCTVRRDYTNTLYKFHHAAHCNGRMCGQLHTYDQYSSLRDEIRIWQLDY